MAFTESGIVTLLTAFARLLFFKKWPSIFSTLSGITISSEAPKYSKRTPFTIKNPSSLASFLHPVNAHSPKAVRFSGNTMLFKAEHP